MAFKMTGHTLPGIKQKKVDPDAPGTPGKPGYEPPVTSMDYLTKTPVGPVAEQKPIDHTISSSLDEVLHDKHAEMTYKKDHPKK